MQISEDMEVVYTFKLNRAELIALYADLLDARNETGLHDETEELREQLKPYYGTGKA